MYYLTDTGDIGLAPKITMRGDIICIFEDSDIPLLVRPFFHAGDDNETYELVGKPYIHGLLRNNRRTLVT
jgi:hypothetical protein